MPADLNSPLGVFDSGVGGLTVLAELKRALPGEDFIYLGDTGRVPYGSKPPEMVRAFASEIAWLLVERGVKGIVVACNTASAISFPQLAEEMPVPIWGVVEPGVAAARSAAHGGRVGVLATTVTVRSRAYQSRLEALGLETWAQPCPLFVPIVEEGVSDSEIAELVARHYLADRPPLGAVILGCTHYPMLKDTLRKVLGPDVVLVDSALETARTVADGLRNLDLVTSRSREGRVRHLVTGDLDSYLHATRILGGPEGKAERVVLSGATPKGSDAAREAAETAKPA